MIALPNMQGQNTRPAKNDSIIIVSSSVEYVMDSVEVDTAKANNRSSLVLRAEEFKPNPTRAVLYSAIFPGLGQLYNRKYWKLPIVYGGFLGCVYAITWNSTQYNGYKNAYNDFTDKDPGTNSWEAYVFFSWKRESDQYKWQDQSTWTSSQATTFTNVLRSKKDYFRRNRDLSYIVTVGVYALCMIDAYVDAQLFDFDISQDLSIRMDPIIIPQTTANPGVLGLQCSITF
jgi:hypothetical protein